MKRSAQAADPFAAMPWPTHTAAAEAAADWAGRLMGTLSTICAIRDDPQLRDVLRAAVGADGGGRFAIEEPGVPTWLMVDGPLVAALREKPVGLPCAGMAQLFDGVGPVSNALVEAVDRTSAFTTAADLMRSLYSPTLPDRGTMRLMLGWAPIIEQQAYAAGAALYASIDELRPRVIAAIGAGEVPRESSILRYWWQMHALANLTIISADLRAQPWLTDMAEQFVWTNWTPTFPLVRERSAWLAACAARSAAAFGEPVVGKYLAALNKTSDPFKVFDALFGLVAIGIGKPAAAKPILAELHVQRRAIDGDISAHADIVRMTYDDAIATLSGERTREQTETLEAAGLKWRPKSPHGLATRNTLRRDPAQFYSGGRLLGFAMLPTVFETPLENFYPVADVAKAQQLLTMRDAVEVVKQAWVASGRAAKMLH